MLQESGQLNQQLLTFVFFTMAPQTATNNSIPAHTLAKVPIAKKIPKSNTKPNSKSTPQHNTEQLSVADKLPS